ncbi:hypothetical protein [Streptobacillus canis]|uniref:hypothetical protein n=1 Tax=Streptobacillus canis TaxID=2678686 RepID=UPI0012E31332|nr:hypothetical protein [Streptobacillus canis]
MNKKYLVIIITALMLLPLGMNILNKDISKFDVLIFSALVILLGILNITKLEILSKSNVVKLNQLNYIRYALMAQGVFMVLFSFFVLKRLDFNGYIVFILSYAVDGELYAYNKEYFYYKKIKIFFDNIKSVEEIQKGFFAEYFTVTLKNDRKVKIGSFKREKLEEMRELLRKKR